MGIILLEVKNVYGKDLIYVKSPEHKGALETLTRQKTLLPNQVQALKDLGFTIVYI